jgi:catecholate siderophore receptor
MGGIKAPRSLRTSISINVDRLDINTTGKVAMAALAAVGSVGTAEAQQSTLPPVTIDAPTTRAKPAKPQLTAEQRRVRAAIRRAAKQKQQAQAAPATGPSPEGAQAPDRSPYANPDAPYKAERLSSTKFSEPIANTPRSITVLTKEILADKNATTLKDVARSTAGVTLGTGEGGNAFGDRFFIRGFDVRNDIFVDGVRDPAVSIRENFFTEQVEILRGPASSFAGRGTAGGAINIVTKQATDRNFYNVDTTFGTDYTKRITFDVNQILSPTLSVRVGGMGQDAGVAGRDYIFDDRWGGFIAAKWTPTDWLKITTNFIHTDLRQLPDFGVPWDRVKNTPFPETTGNRNTFYGFVNRDFQKTRQDIGSFNVEAQVAPNITVSNKFRAERSTLDYIGTLPEAPRSPVDNTNTLVQLNPQSRNQTADVIADQTDITFKYDTGPVRNTTVVGTEFSREKVGFQGYTGLSSEALPGGANGTFALQVPVNAPPNFLTGFQTPVLAGNPTVRTVDTKSGYAIHTANYQDLVIVNGGLRYDDYSITASNNQGANSIDSGMVNWNAGIVLKPLPFMSLYVAYATSSNPVGGELDGTTAQYGGLPATAIGNPTQVFDPERNKSAEVGTKWELFKGRLLVTGALFHTEKENAREIQTTVINGQNVGVVKAGAAYFVEGIDLSVAGKVTDKWSIYGGLVLMRSQVTQSLIPSANPALFPSNVGLQLANVAHESFNVLSKYKITDEWEIGGQATYRSKIYGGTFLAANQGTQLPSYWRFDAFTEYKVTKNLTAKLFVYNIFDTVMYDALYQSATPFVYVAPGRSASLVLSARF